MSGYGIKVSAEGHNVLTATDDKLNFTSEYATFKVLQEGGGTIDATGEVEIAHDISYSPLAFVFLEHVVDENRRYQSTVQKGTIDNSSGDADFEWHIDGDNLYITGAEGIDYSYYIAADYMSLFSVPTSSLDKGEFGIRISQDGYDVFNDADAYMGMIGDGFAPKILSQGYISVASSETISHDLGYYPFFQVWEKYNGKWYQRKNPQYSFYDNINAYVTTSDLIVAKDSGGGEFFYVIYYDELA